MQPVRKEAKRVNLFNIVSNKESRLLSVIDGCLYVFKPINQIQKQLKDIGRFFGKAQPQVAEEPKASV